MKFLPKEIKKIKFKARIDSETNKVYRLCKELERNGINFFLDYPHYNGASRSDVVIIKNREIIGAIEVKRGNIDPIEWSKNEQGKGYLSLSIPIFLICQDYEFPEVIEFFRKQIAKLDETELDKVFKNKTGTKGGINANKDEGNKTEGLSVNNRNTTTNKNNRSKAV